jgi:glycolate oxidase FAD binding subunit
MKAPAMDIGARLQSVVDAARVSAEPAACAEFAVDGVAPATVARPVSAEEVGEIVRFAAAEKLAIIAAGARTKLGIGMPPSRYDIALDMTALNQIAHYDPADLTLSVDAGMPLAKLAEVLGKNNQFVPLAVPFFEESTIGGTIASGIDSALSGLYGTARDFLIGAEFVDGTGKLCKSGGRVVKNVTGYDLHKLLIGSLGTLAVITRLNFRVFPSPKGYGTVVATFSNLQDAFDFKGRIDKSPLIGASIDILSPEMALLFSRFHENAPARPASWLANGQWHAVVNYEGSDAILKRYSDDLAKFANDSRASSNRLLESESALLLGGALREMYELVHWSSPLSTALRFVCLPSAHSAIAQLRGVADRIALPCAVLARASGVVHLWLLPQNEDDRTMALLSQAVSEMLELTASSEIQASIPWAPTELKRAINIWGRRPRTDLESMRKLKSAFDPASIFAPGRFLGGI